MWAVGACIGRHEHACMHNLQLVPFLCPPNRIAIAHTISMQPKAAHIAPGMSHAWRGVGHGTYVAASVVELGVLAT